MTNFKKSFKEWAFKFLFPILFTVTLILLALKVLLTAEKIDGDKNDMELIYVKENLPRVAEIQSYNLTIEPFFPFKGLPEHEKQDFTFNANVLIHFTMTNNFTTKFPFYSEDLNITRTSIWEDDQFLNVKKVTVNKNTNLGFVEIDKNFELNKKYQLYFKFSGIIRKDDVGLFYKEYKNENNNTCYFIATQFEPIAARRVFPCADDPHFKSIITLTLIYPALAKVYSNSDVDKERTNMTLLPHKKLTIFKPTPYMSSYLLAFAIGDFYETSATSKSGVKIRTISYKNVDMSKKAELAVICLDTMEKLLGVPYSHSKLDHLWVEYSKQNSAMENWGLVIYNGVFSVEEFHARYSTYSIICHETAHQWFGNLVTGDVWGQLFLHEAITQYFENHALLENPETIDIKVVESGIQKVRQKGLVSISSGKHSVVTKRAKFDDITYHAGGSIIRMLEKVVGREKFYEALRIYLTKNAYKTATHEDLIKAFEEAIQNQPICGDLKISEFLKDFLLQAAYPRVSITIENQQYIFEQRASNGNLTLKWNIPLFIQEEGKSTEKPQLMWLLKNNTLCSTGSEDNLDSKKDYDFNVGWFSFARVILASKFRGNVFEADEDRLPPSF